MMLRCHINKLLLDGEIVSLPSPPQAEHCAQTEMVTCCRGLDDHGLRHESSLVFSLPIALPSSPSAGPCLGLFLAHNKALLGSGVRAGAFMTASTAMGPVEPFKILLRGWEGAK